MKHFLPALILCVGCLSGAYAQTTSPSGNITPQQYKKWFDERMRVLSKELQVSHSDMGPRPEDEAVKNKQRIALMQLRDNFFPYGNIGAAIKADSLKAAAARQPGGISCDNPVSWQQVGPVGDPEPADNNPASAFFNTNKNGRLDCIAFDPSNADIVYVGSGQGGGLWKINTATTAATFMKTDHIGSQHIGVGAVAVTPAGRVVIASGHHFVDVWWDRWFNSCTGLYYTDDNGNTWNEAYVLDKNGNDPFSHGPGNLRWVSKIIAHPSNPDILYCTMFSIGVAYSKNGKDFGALFRSADGGMSWTEVDDPALTNRFFQDIEYHPSNPGIMYLSGHRVYKSTNGGTAWTDVTTKLLSMPTLPDTTVRVPVDSQVLWQRYRVLLAVPAPGCAPADADHVAALVTLVNRGQDFFIYHSSDALATNVSSTISSSEAAKPEWVVPYHYGFSMAADPDILYAGGKVFQRSNNGGASFSTSNPYWGYIHPDCQDIGVPPLNSSGSNAGKIVLCHDGGLCISNDYGNNWTYINDGLCATQFWGMGVAQTNHVLVAGAQDNFNLLRRNDGTWKGLGTGDGNRFCAVHPVDPEQIAFSDGQTNAHVSYRYRNASGNIIGTTLSTTAGFNNRPYLYAPGANGYDLLAATDRMYRVTNGTTVTAGNTFNTSIANPAHWTSGNWATNFAYCYSQPNIIYLSTIGQWMDSGGDMEGVEPDSVINYNDPLGRQVHNFLKSANGGTTWQLLSTSLPGVTGRITSIAVHPNNPNKIWVTWSGYANASNGNQNVFVSNNGGVSWSNYSTGLPIGSTTRIVYRLGSPNDELFVIADQQVYHRTSDMTEWACYDIGLPFTHVTDIDINYCEGKLYASTYGRGIWSTDLLIGPDNTYNPLLGDQVPKPTTIISSNTTWSSDQVVHSGVLIKSGATLTISNTGSHKTVVYMPKNGAIVVEAGAKIIVDGARITNECNGLWKGIMSLGNAQLSQTPANQPVIIVKNDAVIENARLGVSNYGESVYDGDWMTTTGGIIQAENSTFYNNTRGAGFAPYHNRPYPAFPQIVIGNSSRFINCRFVLDDKYKGEALGYHFSAHVSMSDVEGVSMYGCEFLNEASASAQPNNYGSGFGILTWNSAFSVLPYCSTGFLNNYNSCSGTLKRSSFTGFKAGISTAGDNTNQYNHIKVDYADFNKNSIGISLNSSHHFNIYHTKMTIGNALKPYLPGCFCYTGIYAQNAHLFSIEENEFTGTSLSHPFNSRGVEIEESGAYATQVYRNKFDSLTYGAYATGNNANNATGSASVGLQFLCNAFAYNEKDIYVPYSNNGIRAWQGSPTTPAGNTFVNSGTNPGSLLNYAAPRVDYYYNGSTAAVASHTASGVLKVQPIAVSTTNACPIRYNAESSNPGQADEAAIAKASFLTHSQQWAEAKEELAAQIDNGSTPDEVNIVLDAADAGVLKAHLLSFSPYVSEQVLRTVAEHSKLPVGYFMDVLQQNPDVLRNNEFVQYLGSGAIPEPFPEQSILLLEQYAQQSSARSADEGSIADKYMMMMQDAGDLMAALKTDTAIHSDTLRTWYLKLPLRWGHYAAAWLSLGNGNIEEMEETLGSIPDHFDMEDQAAEEYAAYQDLFALIASVVQDGRNELQLTDDELTALEGIAAGNNGEASVTARTIYQKNKDLLSYNCNDVDAAEAQGGKPVAGNTGNATRPSEKASVKAYPNPAKNQLTVEYKFQKAVLRPVLAVYNITGSKVTELKLTGREGTVKIDTRSFVPGTYLFRINDGGRVLHSGKFAVVK